MTFASLQTETTAPPPPDGFTFDLLNFFLDPCYNESQLGFTADPFYYHDSLLSFQDFTPSPHSKCFVDHPHSYHTTLPTYFLDQPPSVPNACALLPEFCDGTTTSELQGENTSRAKRVSAQSAAARERRRKITEKTQELGKLIPTANKMNTGEMLQAAFKYVKYLQAQVAILQFCHSLHQENRQEKHIKELEILASAAIQEKLYLEEKCLVPHELVEMFANHQGLTNA